MAAEQIHTVEIDGLKVQISVQTDGSGDKYVQLSGLNCDLEGEQPGMYYPVALNHATT